MSIQTEIDRLASAKAAIKTAIESKDVSVPADTLLSGMASLIDEIKTDDGTLLGHEVKCGTITPAEDITSDYTFKFDKIFHSSAYTSSNPYHFFLYRQNADASNSSIPQNSWVWLVMGRRGLRAGYAYGQYTSNSGSLRVADYSGVVGESSYSSQVTINCTTSKKLVAGQTYNWIAIGAI